MCDLQEVSLKDFIPVTFAYFLPSSLYDSLQEEIVIKWNALPLHITVFHLAATLLETFREMYCTT